jgi:hypothetical protein
MTGYEGSALVDRDDLGGRMSCPSEDLIVVFNDFPGVTAPGKPPSTHSPIRWSASVQAFRLYPLRKRDSGA